jgi:SAM-dependent methyltransferase
MSKSGGESHFYDDLFYAYIREGAVRSARALLPVVVHSLGIKSVLDIGCGAGAWLSEFQRLGISDFCGVDGEYVSGSALLIDDAKFIPRDITKPFDFGRDFDLVECLEVAEHVPTEASRILVDNIARHGKRVLFSAAVPGQGGENHINEQPHEFWRDLFRERGYRLFDFVRPAVQESSEIESWYRYNVLFFAHDDIIGTLPSRVTAYRVPDHSAIRDFSPAWYRVQKTVMRMLPVRAVSGMAVLKHKLVTRRLRHR